MAELKSKHSRCSAPDTEVPPCTGSASRIANINSYHYNEMIKRLNGVEQGKIGSAGYFLRRLWKRHESGLAVHATSIYSQQHEQYQKANRSKFEKDQKKGEIGFRKNESGVWGVYTDLLYDTYQKDWSKAYQLTFYCFFRCMDYLSNPREGEFFSYVHSSHVFRFANPDGTSHVIPYSEKHQFGKIIIKDAENLLGNSSKLNAVHALPKHDKAILYDILYGVLCYKGGFEEDTEPYMNGYGYWLGNAQCGFGGFPKILSMDAFAHMASAAIVNAKALEAVKTYLPNSYKAFASILEAMVLGLEERATAAYYMKPTEFGDSFYKFLSDCFPFRENSERADFDKFIKGTYGDNVSGTNLNSLHNAVSGNNMPRPSLIRIEQMGANILGAYRSNVIYINRQIVSDSLLSQETCFILLLALLHEYGHFLDEFLNGPGGGDPDDEKGKDFAEMFMKHSSADLFNKPSFEFADFKALDDDGDEHALKVKISSLSYERRMGIFSLFEYSEYVARGDLELPNGEAISNVEFFSLSAHIELTKGAAKETYVDFNLSLLQGCTWQDLPDEGAIVSYRSHFGRYQHWHSMCPKTNGNLTNEDVKEMIIKQARIWYSEAIGNGFFKHAKYLALGKLCHMVQDSYCLSHCWRRYTWDTDIQLLLLSDEGMNRITLAENGNIWDFQDYGKQRGKYHKCADEPEQMKGTPQRKPTIGYASAENATKEIMRRYRKGLGFYQDEPGSGSLDYYLRHKVYVIYSGRKGETSGKCHPLFSERLGSNIDDVKDGLYRLGFKNQGI